MTNIQISDILLGDIITVKTKKEKKESEKNIAKYPYIVTYRDNNIIELGNLQKPKKNNIVLQLDDTGNKINNYNIKKITLLKRNPKKGFAAQNKLNEGEWVNIHLDGEHPYIFTGKIISAENDIIIVSEKHTNETVKIPFNYQGIPRNTNPIIKEITIRNEPKTPPTQPTQNPPTQPTQNPPTQPTQNPPTQPTPNTSTSNVNLQHQISQANLIFDDEIDDFEIIVEKDETEKRWSISEQLTDLMNTIISNSNETGIYNNIVWHSKIETILKRYTELHKVFSTLDQNVLYQAKKRFQASHRPLSSSVKLLNLSQTPWMLPVVQTMRKLYDIDNIQAQTANDIIPSNLASSIEKINEHLNLKKKITSSENSPSIEKQFLRQLYTLLNELQPPPDMQCMHFGQVTNSCQVIINNYDQYESTIYSLHDKRISSTQFHTLRVSTGFTMLQNINSLSNISIIDQLDQNEHHETNKLQNKKSSTQHVIVTPNDSVCVKSLIYLPTPVIQIHSMLTPNTTILNKINASLSYPSQFFLINSKTKPQPIIYQNESVNFQNNTNILQNHVCEIIPNNDIIQQEQHSSASSTDSLTSAASIQNDSNLISNRSFVAKTTYDRFSIAAVPKMSVFYNTIKINMPQHYNIHKILLPLEVIQVYRHDLVYEVYAEAEQTLKRSILELKKNIIHHTKISTQLIQNILTQPKELIVNEKLSIFIRNSIHNEIQEGYRIGIPTQNSETNDTQNIHNFSEMLKKYTNCEIINKLIKKDNMKLLFSLISRINNGLYFEHRKDDIYQALNILEESNHQLKQTNPKQIQCEKLNTPNPQKILAKIYLTTNALHADNTNNHIYFDPNNDPTRYDILNEHLDTRNSMSYDQFHQYLMNELIQNVGLTDENAYFEAESIIQQKRRVRNNDYAALKTISPDGITNIQYYVRQDNQWIIDTNVKHKDFESSQSCDLTPDNDCVSNSNKCSSAEIMHREIELDAIRSFIMSETYDIEQTLDSLNQTIQTNLYKKRAFLNKMHQIKLIQTKKHEMLYGNLTNPTKIENTPQTSPQIIHIRNNIISQSNFIIKQKNILKFCSYFTRKSHSNEDQYWLYCKETNTKLLPRFIQKIAVAVTQNNNYASTIQNICKEQGTISENGAFWVDKYSGYFITHFNYDTQESYDKYGHQIKTREIIALDDIYGINQNIETNNPETQINSVNFDVLADVRNISELRNRMDEQTENTMRNIAIIIDALYAMMGIPHMGAKSNIVFDMTVRMKSDPLIANEQLWKQHQRKNPDKQDSWIKKYNQTLIQGTLAYIVIYVTTHIPSYTSNKVFPTCSSSFEGYPVSDNNPQTHDNEPLKKTNDCLNYVCCIAHALKKKSFHPWSSIENIKKETIVKSVKNYIEKIQNNKSISAKIKQKEKYLHKLAQKIEKENKHKKYQPDPQNKTTSQTNVMYQSWPNFMPIISSFHMERPSQFGHNHLSNFINLLKKTQLKKIHTFWSELNLIHAKIRQLAFAIQRYIQIIIAKEEPVLMDVNRNLYLENSCCSMETNNVHLFITSKEPAILDCNNYIQYIHSRYIQLFQKYTSITCIQTKINISKSTRNHHNAQLPNNIETLEKMLFNVMIHACNIQNDHLDIPLQFKKICPYKLSNTSANKLKIMDISDKINLLKTEGLLFDIDKFNSLMTIVAKQNTFNAHTMYNPMQFNLLNYQNKLMLKYTNKFKDLFAQLESTPQNELHLDKHHNKQYEILAQYSNNILDNQTRQLYITLTANTPESTNAKQQLINHIETLATIRYNQVKIALTKKGKNNTTWKQFTKIVNSNEHFKMPNDNDFMQTPENERVHHMIQSYYKHIILCTGSIFPSMILNRKIEKQMPHGVPKYWNLSKLHINLIENLISKIYQHLLELTNNTTCNAIFKELIQTMKPVIEFVQECIALKTNPPFNKTDITILLLKYIFISIIHYILIYTPNNPTILQNYTSSPNETRHPNKITTLPETTIIIAKNFIAHYHQTQININFSYSEINDIVTHLEYEERKKITNRFKGNDEERRIQYELKLRKLGEWNVPIKNGVQVHDQEKFDAEINGIFTESDAFNINPVDYHINEYQQEENEKQQHRLEKLRQQNPLNFNQYSEYDDNPEDAYDMNGDDYESE